MFVTCLRQTDIDTWPVPVWPSTSATGIPGAPYAGAGPDLSGPNVVVKVSAVSWQQGPGIWAEGDAGHAG